MGHTVVLMLAFFCLQRRCAGNAGIGKFSHHERTVNGGVVSGKFSTPPLSASSDVRVRPSHRITRVQALLKAIVVPVTPYGS
jgi:hypothetical protein